MTSISEDAIFSWSCGSSCVTGKRVECPAGLNPQQVEFILKLVDAALHVIQRHAIWSDNKGAIDLLHGAYDGHRNPCWFVILVALDAKRECAGGASSPRLGRTNDAVWIGTISARH